MIWTTSKNYMPGTNASLNALEIHGCNPDIYILYWEDCITQEYMKQWPNVTFISMQDKEIIRLWDKPRSNGWHFRFDDMLFALKNLFLQYEIVLFWSGDQCIVNDITDYFGISQKMNKVILGTNEHGIHTFNQISDKWPYKHTWSVPYTDQPIFIPQGKEYVLRKLLEYQAKNDNELSRMDGLNYAIRDCKENIFAVPGEMWIQNTPYRMKLQRRDNKIFFHESTTELCAFHRRYWDVKVCKNYLPENEISKQNKLIFNQMYNHLNKNCRVKWTENLEIWNGN